MVLAVRDEEALAERANAGADDKVGAGGRRASGGGALRKLEVDAVDVRVARLVPVSTLDLIVLFASKRHERVTHLFRRLGGTARAYFRHERQPPSA